MVKTRSKTRRIENIIRNSFLRAMMVDSDHQSTESGTLIGSNDDLLIEILRRLPVTSVLQFKSVSKHWLSLLSKRNFTRLYDKLSRSPGFFVHNSYIPFDIENGSPPPLRRLDFYPDHRGIKIVQSCNGLLLCRSDRGQEYARKYYIFNPTTKQFAIVPPVLRGQDVPKTIPFMILAFDKKDSNHYKVVCIHPPYPNSEQFEIQIYSSNTGKWKITYESSTEYDNLFMYGVYWNGAIHWPPRSITPSYFNLDVERLQKFPLSSQLRMRWTSSRDYDPLYFGAFRGHLHLVDTADSENYLRLNVYEMLTDHCEWVLKYQVQLDELPVAYPEMTRRYKHPSSPDYYDFQVFDVVRGEDPFMVVAIPGKIIRYNILNKSFKEISDLPKDLYYVTFGFLDVHRYTETLTYF